MHHAGFFEHLPRATSFPKFGISSPPPFCSPDQQSKENSGPGRGVRILPRLDLILVQRTKCVARRDTIRPGVTINVLLMLTPLPPLLSQLVVPSQLGEEKTHELPHPVA